MRDDADVMLNRMKCYEVLSNGKIITAHSLVHDSVIREFVLYDYKGKLYQTVAIDGEIISFTEV